MEFALFPIIRSSTPAPPIYAFQSSAAAGINQFLLPSRFGGHGHDLASPFTEEEKKNGRPLKITGAVMKTPGIPNMYDYELYPADTSLFGAKPGIFFYVGNVTMQYAFYFLTTMPQSLTLTMLQRHINQRWTDQRKLPCL